MKRIISILCVAVALLSATFAKAQESNAVMSALENQQSLVPAAVAKASALVSASSSYAKSANLDEMPIAAFKENAQINATAAVINEASVSKAMYMAAPVSVTSLKGEYVITWETLTNVSFDGGGSVTVTPDAEGDSITIERFWSGAKVRAHVDAATGKISIPMQVVGSYGSYGSVYLGVCSSTGAPDKTANIEATVDADGKITFTSWWGIYVLSGTNKDKFIAAYFNTAMVRTNGTITYKRNDAVVSYGVVITQTGANVLHVDNFFNAGLGVDIDLKRDRSAEIQSQVALINASGSWSTIKCVEFNDEGNLTKYSSVISTDKAAENNNNTISWTDWSVLTTGYYGGRITETVLKADNDFSYPQLKVSEFEGDGTEANPYKISSLDHLILLADGVNQDTAYVSTYYNSSYTRSYIGKYFELTNDIDMQGYRFEPIGSTWRQRFAGTFDGKGHTIKGLSVNGTNKYYSGLFGICDTVSVLKNVILENPEVTCSYFYSGSLVSWTFGDVLNVTVNNPKVSQTGGQIVTAGIAGICVGKMDNCHVIGGSVSGYGYVGGVAGEVHGGMTNCSVIATRVASGLKDYPAGGVVGNLIYGKGSNLYFNGMLTYSDYISAVFGGIAGFVGSATLENSFAAGMVACYGSDSMVGGVVGRLSGGKVINCYSAGRVQCYSRSCGGIIGHIRLFAPNNVEVASEVRNCYTSVSLQAETYMYDKNKCAEVIGSIDETATPVLENLYFDKNVTNFYSTRFGATTAELTSAQGPKGFDSSVWTFTEGAYPRLKSLADLPASKYSAAAVLLKSGDTFKKVSANAKLTNLGNTQFFFAKQGKLVKEGYYASIVGDSLKISENFGTDTLYVVNADASVQAYHYLAIAPVPFEGEGTAESPFIIKTKADLIALSNATTNQKQTFPDTYFEMANDIDLEYDEAFVGISTSVADAHNQFAGVFDGKGYAIHKMKLNRVTWTTEPTATAKGTVNTSQSFSYGGFIGRLATEGVLKNLTIAPDADLTFYGTSAALVGYCYGRIENCKNYADVLGVSCWIGGIAGQSLKESVIVNCYNAGNITTYYSNAGGISGASYGTVENCANTGDISAINKTTNYTKQLHHCGGIAGGANGTVIRNCVNYGTVYAERDYAGGISGALEASGKSGIGSDEVYSSVNVGMVYIGGVNAGTAPNMSKIGSIGGSAGTKTASGTYWDAQIMPILANGYQDVVGMTGLNTAQLISGSPLDSLSTEIWDFKKGMYPTLKIFADEAEVKAARNVILSIPDGSNAYDLHVDAVMNDGADWKLAKGTVFSIDGSTLKAPATVDQIVIDTLYATDATGWVKPILLKSMPAIPLTGKGTADNPYLINTADEWNAFAKYIMATGNSMEAEFIKVTADLDFTGKTPADFANDGVLVFAGTLDGDNHTVKGLDLNGQANQKSALIGTIGAEGVLKNITFEGTQTGKAKCTYTVGVVDKLYGTLENVVSDIDVTGSTASYTAGVVGYVYEGAKLNKVINKGTITSAGTYVSGIAAYVLQNVSFTDCGNEGEIKYTGTSSAANVAGVAAYVLPSTFVGCYNKGAISVNTASAGCVAGLVANTPGLKGNPEYVFTKCWNEAAISASSKVAGLVAAVPTSSSNAANAVYTFTDCYNSGDISAMSAKAVSSSPTAGIITLYTPGSSFINCYNEGNIISEKNVYTAGIVGNNLGTPNASAPVIVKGCYNTGNIVADGNQGGGIMGYASGHVYLEDCYNTGDIEGNQMVGGIVSGFSGSSPKMTNCYNTGNITAKQYRAGGLIAWGAPTGSVVYGCWNTGNVSSTSSVGTANSSGASSIGGIAGQGGAQFVDCYNAGTVSGLAQVGGLIGTPVKDKTALKNCYNAGAVVAPADTCGALVGVSVTAGRLWTENNTVVNSFFLDTDTCGNNTLGTAVSRAALAKLDIDTAFVSVDDYTFPVLDKDNKTAVFKAAQVIVADGDSYDKVTNTFHVGAPDIVTWSSDCADLQFEGNDGVFMAKVTAKVVVKATCGDLVKTVELNAVNTVTGIDNIEADAEVESAIYFTPAGVQVPKPESVDGQVYIVVLNYVDGSQKVVKLINK